jgi:hypothetical protein
LSTRLPVEPRARNLAKMDMLMTLYLRSAEAKGLPVRFGPWDGIKMAHDQLLKDPDYWLAVFEKAKVIINL